jgi:hypothetical protein
MADAVVTASAIQNERPLASANRVNASTSQA